MNEEEIKQGYYWAKKKMDDTPEIIYVSHFGLNWAVPKKDVDVNQIGTEETTKIDGWEILQYIEFLDPPKPTKNKTR